MRISDPVLVANDVTFAPELTMTLAIPLEPIMDMDATGRMTEQEFAQMVGQEVMQKIKNRHNKKL